MANDRIYLRCRACHEGFMIFAFWGGGEGQTPDRQRLPGVDEGIPSTPFAGALEAWLLMHLKDCDAQHGFAPNLDKSIGFEVITEKDLGVRQKP